MIIIKINRQKLTSNSFSRKDIRRYYRLIAWNIKWLCPLCCRIECLKPNKLPSSCFDNESMLIIINCWISTSSYFTIWYHNSNFWNKKFSIWNYSSGIEYPFAFALAGLILPCRISPYLSLWTTLTEVSWIDIAS